MQLEVGRLVPGPPLPLAAAVGFVVAFVACAAEPGQPPALEPLLGRVQLERVVVALSEDATVELVPDWISLRIPGGAVASGTAITLRLLDQLPMLPADAMVGRGALLEHLPSFDYLALQVLPPDLVLAQPLALCFDRRPGWAQCPCGCSSLPRATAPGAWSGR